MTTALNTQPATFGLADALRSTAKLTFVQFKLFLREPVVIRMRVRVKSKKRYLRPIPEAAIRESGLLRFNITLITTKRYSPSPTPWKLSAKRPITFRPSFAPVTLPSPGKT